MAELKKDGIRAAISEQTERETLKSMAQRTMPERFVLDKSDCVDGGDGCKAEMRHSIAGAFVYHSEIERARAAVAGPRGDALLSAMWNALKDECCKVPADAKQVVFLGEEKFRKALAPFAVTEGRCLHNVPVGYGCHYCPDTVAAATSERTQVAGEQSASEIYYEGLDRIWRLLDLKMERQPSDVATLQRIAHDYMVRGNALRSTEESIIDHARKLAVEISGDTDSADEIKTFQQAWQIIEGVVTDKAGRIAK